jgi:hypothetical protein
MPDRATMPDERSGPDYIQLDALAESIGEDPARWLEGPLDPHPRIRGFGSVKRVRGWIAAERKFARIRNRDPREGIIDALKQREVYLNNHEPDPDFERDVPEKTVLLKGEPYDEVDRAGALERVQQRVATDGGETEDA